MRNDDFLKPKKASNALRVLNERRVSWHPATTQTSPSSQSLVALDPAHWSQRHQQATSWLLVEFLQTHRNLQ
jgi:hypothetical protein